MPRLAAVKTSVIDLYPHNVPALQCSPRRGPSPHLPCVGAVTRQPRRVTSAKPGELTASSLTPCSAARLVLFAGRPIRNGRVFDEISPAESLRDWGSVPGR